MMTDSSTDCLMDKESYERTVDTDVDNEIQENSSEQLVAKKVDTSDLKISETESSSDVTDNKFDSSVSDHEVKINPKPLESEPELRNTSTSNAGESEYESANEEDLEFSTVSNQQHRSTNAYVSQNVDKSQSTKISADLTNKDPSTFCDSESCVIIDKKIDDSVQSDVQLENIDNGIEPCQIKSDTTPLDDEVFSENIDSNKDSDKSVASEDLSNKHLNDESVEEFDEERSFDEEASEMFNDNEIEESDPNHLENIEPESFIKDDIHDDEEFNQEVSLKSNQLSAKATKKSEIEDKRNPQYIPRKGPFYEHDDRINEDDAAVDENDHLKSVSEVDEIDTECVKLKAKKKPLASMKLCSDEMIEDDTETDKAIRSSVSSEKSEVSFNAGDTRTKDNGPQNEQADLKPSRENRRKNIWESGERWSHDKFNADDQQPKTRDELINHYGYDIRGEEDAPKLQRRSKYGKGPQKYSRRSDDENAYGKKGLRKVAKPSTQAKPMETFDSSYSKPISKKDKIFASKPTAVNEDNDRFNPNMRSPPKDIAVNNFSGKPNKYLETNNSRPHENGRVFVNKSTKFTKANDKHSAPQVKEKFKENFEPKKDLSRETNANNSNQLFNKEDFPELVASAPKSSKTLPSNTTYQNSTQTSSSKIIFYQQNDTKSVNTLQSTNSATDSVNSYNSSSISECTSMKGKTSMPMDASQLFENSPYSRIRVNASFNQDYNSNWNGRSPKSQYPSSQSRKPQQVNISSKKEEEMNASEHTEDSRPKRYSSIRQQRNQNFVVNNSNANATITQSNSQQESAKSFGPINQVAQNPPQYPPPINNEEKRPAPKMISSDSPPKNAYYESATANVNDISHGPATNNLMSTSVTLHHQTHTHNYVPINGTSTVSAPSATPSAFIPNQNLVYYDPTNANAAQSAASTTPANLGTIGLPQAYFTDQTGTAQAVPNYYLTAADLTAVAYNPAAAYHLQANYPQQLTSHHTHQTHVANRYLNTTPSNANSADSNRYLQTASSNQNSSPLIVTGAVPNIPAQAYQPAMQTAFPSGYPQFPPPAPSGATPTIGTSSPLPAGYPNVQLGATSSNSPSTNAQQATASGYPELYRGGITYYDIQSQQQAMHRHFHQNMAQPQSHRRGKGVSHSHAGSGETKNEISDGGDTNGDMVKSAEVAHKHTANTNEIPVNN